MTEENRIPFDLERALAGDPVVTRDGKKIIEIYKCKSDVKRPIVAVIEGVDDLCAFKTNGYLYSSEYQNIDDLFMSPKPKKKLWMGVRRIKNDCSPYPEYFSTDIWQSLEMAEDDVNHREKKKDYQIIEIEVDDV